jgi:hypothetical protein
MVVGQGEIAFVVCKSNGILKICLAVNIIIYRY